MKIDHLCEGNRLNSRRLGCRACRGGEKFKEINFVANRGFERDAGEGEQVVAPALAHRTFCCLRQLRIPKRMLPGAGDQDGVLPSSMLPADLRELGYYVRDVGEGERILANAIVEKLTMTSCGVFEVMTEGSTKAVAQVRHHAGIARVLRYSLPLP
jgi:hypothetical protein